jgi:uncharacterized RDD family membrane protein YckC
MSSNAPRCSNCPPTWKKIVAFLIDFFGSFFIFGYLIAYFSGDLSASGFELQGMPALLLFALIISYFIIMKKFFGGTFGKKLLGIAKPKT